MTETAWPTDEDVERVCEALNDGVQVRIPRRRVARALLAAQTPNTQNRISEEHAEKRMGGAPDGSVSEGQRLPTTLAELDDWLAEAHSDGYLEGQNDASVVREGGE